MKKLLILMILTLSFASMNAYYPAQGNSPMAQWLRGEISTNNYLDQNCSVRQIESTMYHSDGTKTIIRY